eukprot:scaffold2093_cov161-Amphora_coffeaeformis.AAC.13
MAPTKEDLIKARTMIQNILLEKNCGPICVRLAWHDSGTFDKNITGPWPKAGGAIGSIRFEPEINHGANKGLSNAIAILQPVKDAVPSISYADLFQMASAEAIMLAGGPKIDMKYGRIDAESPEQCSPEGNLPDGNAGANNMYGGAGGTTSTEDNTPAGHLRKVFHRMGIDDEGIVALSGAHTYGRAYKDRSGAGAEKTKFTDGKPLVRADGKTVVPKPGGSSWVENFLVFDNSYYQVVPDEKADPELLKLSTDKVLFVDPGFKPFAEKFRDSQEAFFESYAKAHKQLSEQGSKFEPPEGITL